MFDMPTNLVEFLTWIVYGGGAAISASFILEKMAWYTEKPGEVKKNIYFGIVTTFTILMYLVLNYVPQTILEAITPYFGIIAISFINVYLGTSFHRAAKTTTDTVEISQPIVGEFTTRSEVLKDSNVNVNAEMPNSPYEIKG